MFEKMIDISMDLSSETIIYPGDPRPEIGYMFRLKDGDIANVGKMTTGLHHGTHVDVPVHFFDGGQTLDRFPLKTWVGEALVVDLTQLEKCITAKDLKEIKGLEKQRKVLFKTRNSTEYYKKGKFIENFIYLDGGAARHLVDIGVKTVGIDYITIDPYGSADFPAHRTLLGNGVVIIESINLEKVEPGLYNLVCLPIKIKGSDGAPARAILLPSNI